MRVRKSGIASEMRESGVEGRRRETSPAVRISRDAARLVREINDKLGVWQADSIRLAMAAERMRQSGRHDPAIVEQIGVLSEQVERQAEGLELLLVGVPPEIAGHSRVQDTRRVLRMVRDRLHGTVRSNGAHRSRS